MTINKRALANTQKNEDHDELDIRELSMDPQPNVNIRSGRDSPDFNNLSSSDIKVEEGKQP
jgi:hypothetical protein